MLINNTKNSCNFTCHQQWKQFVTAQNSILGLPHQYNKAAQFFLFYARGKSITTSWWMERTRWGKIPLLGFGFPSSSQSTRKENPIKFAAQYSRSIIHTNTLKRPRLHPVIQTFQIRFLLVLAGKKTRQKLVFFNEYKKKQHTKRGKTKQDKKKPENKKTWFCVWCQAKRRVVFFFLSLIYFIFHHFCRTRSARVVRPGVCVIKRVFFLRFSFSTKTGPVAAFAAVSSSSSSSSHAHTTSRRCLHATAHTHS